MPRPSNNQTEKELFQKIGNSLFKYSKIETDDLEGFTRKINLLKIIKKDVTQILKVVDINREIIILEKIDDDKNKIKIVRE